MLFRQLLSDSTQRIDALAKRLGKCVEQSRPYYEARIQAKQVALRETQTAAWRYERASSQHAAAREMVFLAEEGLMEKGCSFDHTWQEMLNHATAKVNDAEKERMESAVEHRRTSALYHEAETRVKALQKELKRAIAKSRPYFELKSAVNQQLEAQKQQVRQLEESVGRAKMTYSQALTNLETISNEIHQNRQCQELGVRGIGVGADSPLPPLHSVEARVGLLTTQPLHYAEAILGDNAAQEFKSLPGKLGPVATPILAMAQVPKACVAPVSASSLSTVPDCCEKKCAEEKVESKDKQCVTEQSGEIIVEEVDEGTTSTDLSGWQVIGLPTPPTGPSQHYLAVEDRDSTVSDTESLASIEMLSDEAIAGLMLDEELAQASSTLYSTSAPPTPVMDPPLPASSSIHFLTTFFHSEGGGGGQHVEGGSGPAPLSTRGGDCCGGLTHSLMALKVDSCVPEARPHLPPDTLRLMHQDSSSDHSSPEDLTPGYAPLRDTPCSPDDFLSPGQTSPPSTSTSEEAPHCSSWVMENTPVGQKQTGV
ncbi:SH3 domain-binding protein 5-like [Chionoecetes opilio]|uniref:SH3 domain-binding protein 5-like n=1 Tax=Chionoecetes opilio TaxID=41210 RepID=A0A8J4YGF5_CHIOP|nr:SH3 domain-binding protein 5-like [Chionoecetes opilio]